MVERDLPGLQVSKAIQVLFNNGFRFKGHEEVYKINRSPNGSICCLSSVSTVDGRYLYLWIPPDKKELKNYLLFFLDKSPEIPEISLRARIGYEDISPGEETGFLIDILQAAMLGVDLPTF
jgi:hypothetical protein